MRISRIAAAALPLALSLPFVLAAPGASPGAVPATNAVPAADGSRATSRLWAPPLGSPLRILAGYSLPDGPYRAGHRGVDLPASRGDEVRSPAAGSVTFVGVVVDRPVLSILVEAGTVVSLEPVESLLAEGEPVGRNQPLGTVGAGGHCDGACLHVGVRVEGRYVNPLRFLRPRPVLLPW